MKKTREYHERACHGWSDDSIRLMATPSSLARSAYLYVQECGYFKTNDTYFTERENLNSFLLVYTLSGEGLLTYGGRKFPLTSGACFFIDCMEYSYYATKKSCQWDFLWAHFHGVGAPGYYEEFIRGGTPVIQIAGSFPLADTLRELISIHQEKNIFTEVRSSGLISAILAELVVSSLSDSAASFSLPGYLKDILKYLDQHFTSQITLDFLSGNYGISKYHLEREFKKYTGAAVHEYIISARLSYAKELLQYSDIPVSEIAFQSGFNHVSHFIRLFKDREGMTPLQYRKEWM